MSRFLSEKEASDNSSRLEIDFEDAIRLPDGGSTCDIYRTRWHRREVFVKRLKEDYRTNPLYLDALEKEYEIGVSLKHPSLPDYREFHREYIVMDFIDGETLVDMIKNQDPWLRNEKNIIRMLRELIDVVDYLHRHNVTHCDIKPDNIMITANNKNLVLIDLDKCYTDSLNDTSGDPSKYGLSQSQKGRIAIDFNGIGRVVEIMKERIPGFTFSRYSAFVKECYKPDVSAETLLQNLDYKPGNLSKKISWMVTLAPFFVALIYGGILLLTQGKDGYDVSYGIEDPAPQEKDTVSSKPIEKIEAKENDKEEKIEPPSVKAEALAPLTQEQIHAQAQEMAEQLDKRIRPYFDELNTSLDSIEKIKENAAITPEQLTDAITIHMNKEEEYCQEAFEILNEIYPGLSDREAWRVMAYSQAYTGYKRRAAKTLSPQI